MEYDNMPHQATLHFYAVSEKNLHPLVLLHLLWQNQAIQGTTGMVHIFVMIYNKKADSINIFQKAQLTERVFMTAHTTNTSSTWTLGKLYKVSEEK